MKILELNDYGFHGVVDLDKVVYVSDMWSYGAKTLMDSLVISMNGLDGPVPNYHEGFTYQFSDENDTREFKSENIREIDSLHSAFKNR